MLYAIRNLDGSLLSISRVPAPGSSAVEDSSPEIQAFLGSKPSDASFDAVDAGFVRVLEDLIDTLISKNIIRHTDLPPAAQTKLLLRKGLRNSISGALNLIDPDERVL
jgi:hypothetical protein